MSIAKLRSIQTLLGALGVAGLPVAQAVDEPATSGAPEELTPALAQAHFDEAWRSTISPDGKIPGAVIVVVKDSQVVFAKGYGVTDIDKPATPDPQTTRVRIGSVSKVLSAVTALSFVDDGTIQLDTDVNTYLKNGVHVPATFPEPITPRSMLSHLSGFDAGISGWMANSVAETYMDPAEFNRRLIRLHPTGLVYAYDNRGIGLMGYVAGQLDGGGLASAMKKRLFDPLGMTNSSMGITDEVMPLIAACHTVDEKGTVVKCRHQRMREDVQAAGDVTSTGTDMGRFMMALLNGGQLEGKRVLSPELFQQFFDADQNRLHPILLGMGFIIVEGNMNGHRTMGHTGGMNGFSTNMTLFPESNTGVFISSFTSYAGIPTAEDDIPYRLKMKRLGPALAQVNQYHRMDVAISSFADRFVKPSAIQSRKPAPTQRTEPLSMLDGHFAMANANVYPLMERMLIAVADPAALTVSVRGDDVFISGQGPYREVEPYVLQKDGDPTRWVFMARKGGVLLTNTSNTVASPWLKMNHYVSGKLTVVGLFAAIVLCLTAGIYALRRSAAARVVAAFAFAAGVAALVGLFLEFQYFPSEYFRKGGSVFMYGWRTFIHLGWLAALAAVAIGVFRYRTWARWQSAAGVIDSGYVLVILLSAAVLAVLLPYWGLIGNFTH